MAAPILWAPGIYRCFLRPNLHARTTPRFEGRGGGVFWVSRGEAIFWVFWGVYFGFIGGGGGAECPYHFDGRKDSSDTRKEGNLPRG